MNVTDPCISPQKSASSTSTTNTINSNNSDLESTSKPSKCHRHSIIPQNLALFKKVSVYMFHLALAQSTVSQSAVDMLAQLFPHRKRSVLELVLRRCDLDLLRAIEQCSPATAQAASSLASATSMVTTSSSPTSAFRPPTMTQVNKYNDFSIFLKDVRHLRMKIRWAKMLIYVDMTHIEITYFLFLSVDIH